MSFDELKTNYMDLEKKNFLLFVSFSISNI